MLDNIVLFYIFFTIVGFLAAMLGTIIGAGGGLYLYLFLCTGSLNGLRLWL